VSTRAGSTRIASSAPKTPDHELFPPAFLRLLAALPAAVARIRAGASEGRRATPGQGGRFLFRGHRVYRAGDDLRRVDWKVAARLGRLLVRQFDEERDLLTEVWLDGSASMAPWGGRVKTARAAALACAIGVATAGRTRLGVLAEGRPRFLLEASQPGRLVEFLQALTSAAPTGRADLSSALPRLVKRVPPKSRLVLISDLLSRAEPGILHALAGRGLRGALMHLRVPQVTAPHAAGTLSVRDVETGTVKTVHFDEALVARVAARARAHAKAWALHGNAAGLHYVPFAPTTADEDLLRRLVGDLP
jgi:uncharacterized protein (DUF58 family)